jgi:transposase
MARSSIAAKSCPLMLPIATAPSLACRYCAASIAARIRTDWAREFKKLGHDARLMPPTYVKAYVKRGKNDAADAAAICEAVTRPSMRFVSIKSVEQQSALMLHRTRDLLIRQRTQLINALRAHLAELGLVAAKGREGVQQLVQP